MARGDQLSRQWRIIQALIASRMGKTVAELAGELACHPRSVYRDLDALQAAGFPLYTDKTDGKSRWRLIDAARHHIPIPFSLTELMALYFSRDMLRGLKNTVFHDSLESLLEKIRATLPPEYVRYLKRMADSLAVAPKPYKPAGEIDAVVDRLSKAIAEKRVVAMTYYTMQRQTDASRRVAPYKIWFSDDTFYLIGACRMRKEMRIFALDRIRRLHVTDERFSPPEGLDLDAQLRASFGVFLGKTETVRVWFSAAVAGYIREKVWHDTQKIDENPDGSIVFEACVAGTEEIKFWILKWGASARVLAPPELKKQIAAEVAAMGDLYRDKK